MNRQLTAFLLLLWFLLLSGFVMFGQVRYEERIQVKDSTAIWRPVFDTLRVRMLVAHKGNTRNVAFTMEGYQVGEMYLDDRKRVIKNLDVWQIKIIGK